VIEVNINENWKTVGSTSVRGYAYYNGDYCNALDIAKLLDNSGIEKSWKQKLACDICNE